MGWAAGPGGGQAGWGTGPDVEPTGCGCGCGPVGWATGPGGGLAGWAGVGVGTGAGAGTEVGAGAGGRAIRVQRSKRLLSLSLSTSPAKGSVEGPPEAPAPRSFRSRSCRRFSRSLARSCRRRRFSSRSRWRSWAVTGFRGSEASRGALGPSLSRLLKDLSRAALRAALVLSEMAPSFFGGAGSLAGGGGCRVRSMVSGAGPGHGGGAGGGDSMAQSPLGAQGLGISTSGQPGSLATGWREGWKRICWRMPSRLAWKSSISATMASLMRSRVRASRSKAKSKGGAQSGSSSGSWYLARKGWRRAAAAEMRALGSKRSMRPRSDRA